MGRKGFPGKVGPEGVKVQKKNTFYNNISITSIRTLDLFYLYGRKVKLRSVFLQGETGITGNVGSMGERVRQQHLLLFISPDSCCVFVNLA